MPQGYQWMLFLEYQGWLDTAVLGRQPHWWVYQSFEVYCLRKRYGMLREAMF